MVFGLKDDIMVIGLKYESSCVYEYFFKELNDNLTIKELKELIEKEYYNWFKEYIYNMTNYSEKEKHEKIMNFLREDGICRWAFKGDIYVD